MIFLCFYFDLILPANGESFYFICLMSPSLAYIKRRFILLYLSLSKSFGLMRELNPIIAALERFFFLDLRTDFLCFGVSLRRWLKFVFPVEDCFSNIWNQYLLLYLLYCKRSSLIWFRQRCNRRDVHVW